jgi:dipeptidyl aminopeptidase/acylaminoacyl peptidase
MTATAFDNLDDYLALPRVSGLAVSADGSRVVTTVAELNDKRSEYVSAVWEVDPAGERPARRLTAAPTASRHRRSPSTATSFSSPHGRLPKNPVTQTNRPRRCGGCPQAAARRSRC